MKKLLLVLVSSLILTACSGFGVRSEKGPKADGEFAKGQIVMGFPNIPAYPESKIIESYGQEGKFGVSSISEEELAKVVNFYAPALSRLGWQNSLTKNSETNFEYEISNDEFKGSVIINTAADGESTAISVFVEPR